MPPCDPPTNIIMSFVVKVKKNSKPKEPAEGGAKAADVKPADDKPEPEKKKSPSPFKKIIAEIAKIEKELEKVPILVELSKTYKHEKCTIAATILGAAVFAALVIYDIKAAFLVDILSYFYPAYQSVKSIEKGEKGQYKQWLSYWYEIWFDLKGYLESNEFYRALEIVVIHIVSILLSFEGFDCNLADGSAF
jgi:hypothetical protein